jgi:hypothetical protein
MLIVHIISSKRKMHISIQGFHNNLHVQKMMNHVFAVLHKKSDKSIMRFLKKLTLIYKKTRIV